MIGSSLNTGLGLPGPGASITGTGTSGAIGKFTGSATVGDSLLIEGTNTITQRNGTNGQSHVITGTYVAADNLRALTLAMSNAGAATITATGLGAGATGNLLSFAVNAVTCLAFSTAGSATFGGSVFIPSTNRLAWLTKSAISSPVNGELLFQNSAQDAYSAVKSLYQRWGAGSPEGVETAPVGCVYHNTTGGALTSFYVKESGTGNTGWVFK